MANWNPWHGCHKLSEGCRNCYVYRMDAKHGRDTRIVTKLNTFDLPIRKKANGEYKIPAGEIIYTCFTSDFFLEDADPWREEAWSYIRERRDCHFFMITKRIDRFSQCVPDDWGDGYDHVTICCTVENQDRAEYRLPIYQDAHIKHKSIICEPLLGPVNVEKWLDASIEQLVAGGESGSEARVCYYDWILDLRAQCLKADVPFYFKQTGAKFVKDGKFYRILRKDQHHQARKAGIDHHAVYPKYK